MVRGRGLASPLRANSDGLATVVALFALWANPLREPKGDVGPSLPPDFSRLLISCARVPHSSPTRVRPPKLVLSRSFDRSR